MDVLGQQLTEIERGGGAAWIGDVDAVDEHLGMIGIGAAQEHRSLAARAALLHHIQSGNLLQQIGQRSNLSGVDVFGSHNGDAARHFDRRRGNPGGGYHHRLQVADLAAVGPRRRQRYEQQRGAGRPQT